MNIRRDIYGMHTKAAQNHRNLIMFSCSFNFQPISTATFSNLFSKDAQISNQSHSILILLYQKSKSVYNRSNLARFKSPIIPITFQLHWLVHRDPYTDVIWWIYHKALTWIKAAMLGHGFPYKSTTFRGDHLAGFRSLRITRVNWSLLNRYTTKTSIKM